MYCQNCGNEVSDNAVFCEKCGTSLKSDAPVTPPLPEPTPAKNKKEVTARTFLSIGLLISFFLPWIDFGTFTVPPEMKHDFNSVYEEAIRQNKYNDASTIAGLSAVTSSLLEDIGGLSQKVVNGFNLYIIVERYDSLCEKLGRMGDDSFVFKFHFIIYLLFLFSIYLIPVHCVYNIYLDISQSGKSYFSNEFWDGTALPLFLIFGSFYLPEIGYYSSSLLIGIYSAAAFSILGLIVSYKNKISAP
jgi:hypothetical protein